MIQILLTKVFPMTLTVSVLALLIFSPDWIGIELWIFFGGLVVIDGLIFIWIQLRKAPSISIADGAIIVSGVRIDRCDIQAWRIFRASHNGERGRYIEIQLKSVPTFKIEWKLVKLFEQVPSSKRCYRGIPLAKEPRIIASLNNWDPTEGELSDALNNSESGPQE